MAKVSRGSNGRYLPLLLVCATTGGQTSIFAVGRFGLRFPTRALLDDELFEDGLAIATYRDGVKRAAVALANGRQEYRLERHDDQRGGWEAVTGQGSCACSICKKSSVHACLPPDYQDLFAGAHVDRRAEQGAIEPIPPFRDRWVGYRQSICSECGERYWTGSNSATTDGRTFCYLICKNYHRWMADGRQ